MNKKIITVLSLSAFLFAACGSDDSSSANDNEKSSSSVAVEECDEDDCDEELDEKSSSSKKGGSESSDSKDEKSSSSSAEGPSVVSKGEIKDSRDGKVYKTVKIGAQTWMAENLAYKTADSKCSSDDSDCKNGRLYHWADVMDLGVAANTSSAALLIKSRNKGICPEGFHVPNKSDYERLFTQPWVDNVFRNYFIRENGKYEYIDHPTDAESLVFGSDEECKMILSANSSYKESDLKSCNLYKFNGSLHKEEKSNVDYWTALEEGDDKALGASLLNAKYVFGEKAFSSKSDMNYLRCVSDEELCGDKELQDNQYCYNDKVYEKAKPGDGVCGEFAADDAQLEGRCYGPKDSEGLVAYSPVKFFEDGGRFYPLCGGEKLVAGQFCTDGKVYNKCEGNVYDVEKEFCSNNTIYSRLCNGEILKESQFCVDGKAYDKCGGEVYDLVQDKCVDGKINKPCGESYYIYGSNQRCRNNQVVEYETFTDKRDGQVYTMVKIGSQTWMAENLNFMPKNPGYEWSWCYEDNLSYCETYGRLYTWAAAMDSAAVFSESGAGCGYDREKCQSNGVVRGICPEGWHLPSKEEWETLIEFAGGETVAGKNFKSVGDWDDSYNDGVDYYGFTALPAGTFSRSTYEGLYREEFVGKKYKANFWSANVGSCFECYGKYSSAYIYQIRDEGYLTTEGMRYGLSIRCLKD